LVAIGAGLAVRRAALAHIVYNVTVGIIGILLLGPLAAAANWVGTQLDDPNGVLALGAFSSIFKFAGVLAFYPWLDRFSRFIEGISGAGAETAVSRLEPTLAEAGGAIALEAAWRATLELAHGSVDAVRRRLVGESVRYDPPVEGVRQTEQFLESLSLETTDLTTFEPRLVRLCHALDHLNQLNDDLTRLPSEAGDWQPPAGFEAGARALGAWLDATKDPKAASNRAIFKAVEDASRRLDDKRKTGRDKILEDVALQRVPAETARNGLEMLAWADGALYHAWRLAESLRIAAGG
jgi:phosphate:Na+ symporter